MLPGQDRATEVSAWTRLIAGSDARKSRLHDRLGARVPFRRAIRNGPRALAGGIARLLFGFGSQRPWISYDAQAILAKHVDRRTRVLEFGSGMSTVWLARRAGKVVSIEHDQRWFDLIQRRMRHLGNAEYRLAAEHDDYIAVPAGARYDLILIDGPWRLSCAMVAIAHLASGGIIYFDNSDKFADVGQLLVDIAQKRGLEVREFIDFAPTQLFVQRGLMIGP